ncbi:methyl-accepting chemotaxis protein [Massilia sp. G4R7]|uniref:Methyl-accepting chemotaxis protein n=3 Tax=Massilia TaxID=149698 RepID=A0ABS8Q0S5_9BURK|nr:methyl-accepting chemotaxis protein [Massilia phyllostachyos]MCD2515353.1 methyl-accepting chemotaxis protein [Massilia phyllostachyos]
MTFSHLTIRTRLRLGFASVLAAVVLVAGIGMYELGRANDATTHIVQANLAKIDHLEEMSDAVHVVARVIRSIALLQDQDAAARESAKIAAAREKYDVAVKGLAAMPLDEAGRDFVAKIRALQDKVLPMNDRFMEMSRAGDAGAISYLLKEAGPVTGEWQDTIREFITLQKKKSVDDAHIAAEAYDRALTLMVAVTALTLLAGGAFAYVTARSITAPMEQAVGLARTVASGDLSSTVEVDEANRSETGDLLRALADMNGSLNRIVRQVREDSGVLGEHAREIATGNLDLSSRTEQQASAIEETAASMEEISSTVKQNADNAREASDLAAGTVSIAGRGGQAVGQLVERMASIEETSAKIVDIISVIDGIAFQTNILALNAAVEAARAGEQGRGFAVVASEVRNLAQRSATAAHEIKHLITASVEEIRDGGQLARDAGATMGEIVDGIGKVAQFVTDIAGASREQSTGIEQTYAAVSEIDQITQSNAALVEELAATAQGLNDRAEALGVLVQHFRVDAQRVAAGSLSGERALVLHAA